MCIRVKRKLNFSATPKRLNRTQVSLVANLSMINFVVRFLGHTPRLLTLALTIPMKTLCLMMRLKTLWKASLQSKSSKSGRPRYALNGQMPSLSKFLAVPLGFAFFRPAFLVYGKLEVVLTWWTWKKGSYS